MRGLLLALVLVAGCGSKSRAPGLNEHSFTRGRITNDLLINLADVQMLLLYLFDHGVGPECSDSMDMNDDGQIDIADPVVLLWQVYHGMTVPPWLWSCSRADKPDSLPCSGPGPGC